MRSDPTFFCGDLLVLFKLSTFAVPSPRRLSNLLWRKFEEILWKAEV